MQPYFSKNNNDILKLGQELHSVLDESAKNRTMGDVPICTMLSGGIDSVLTTYYVLKNINFNKVDFEPTSYVFKVKGFDSIDVKTAKVATAGFEKIGLKLRVIEAEENQIVNDMPRIVETFEMRELKALSFYPLPIYWYLAPAMTKDKFKVTIGGHGVMSYSVITQIKLSLNKVEVKAFIVAFIIIYKKSLNNIHEQGPSQVF